MEALLWATLYILLAICCFMGAVWLGCLAVAAFRKLRAWIRLSPAERWFYSRSRSRSLSSWDWYEDGSASSTKPGTTERRPK